MQESYMLLRQDIMQVLLLLLIIVGAVEDILLVKMLQLIQLLIHMVQSMFVPLVMEMIIRVHRNTEVITLQVMKMQHLFALWDVLIIGEIGQLIITQLTWLLLVKVYIAPLLEQDMRLGMDLLWQVQMQQAV